MTPEDRAARKAPEKSWAQEQLEDPEMFSAFCAELEREAGTRAARKALLSLARWHRDEMKRAETLRKFATKAAGLSTADFYRAREITHREGAREAERRARRIGK
jgi:hypothetical protein